MKNKKGFTLIEILVVVFIIGLLASIIIVSVNEARKKARDSRRVADLFEVRNAVEMYFNANSHYPITGVNLSGRIWRNSVLNSTNWTPSVSPADGGNSITSLPVDPINIFNPPTMCYTYEYTSGDGKDYKLRSCTLETVGGRTKAMSDGGYWNCPLGVNVLDTTGACSYELYSANASQWH